MKQADSRPAAPEGNSRQGRIHERGGAGVFDYEFVKSIPGQENRLEGYLFPDTYEVFVRNPPIPL